MAIGGCYHAGCGSSGVFYHTNAAAESKLAREMLCFTIETAAGGREGRRCRTGGCGPCSRYVRVCPRWFAVARAVMVVHMVCGAVPGASAFKELQSAL